MYQAYQDLFNKVAFPLHDIKEKKKRHEFEMINLGKDLLNSTIKPGLEQMRR
ncbi:hypothetical protein AN619_25270 [Thermotalea metallivorans]|uniref:Uncharacterized protein n=1 Tax=Thermotalea metallivorans TaxID=520762 RepID=A0A140L0Y4_9FIRM|nr:hypothetical protein AN619_25270 [Thermotalea metallivorans]